MKKIFALLAVGIICSNCSDSKEQPVYDPSETVSARPVIRTPSGLLAFRLSDTGTSLIDKGNAVQSGGSIINVSGVPEYFVTIEGTDESATFTVNTSSRPGATPAQESLTLSIVDAATGKVIFSRRNISKSGDDLFIFDNIYEKIDTKEIDNIIIRVRNEEDGNIWASYPQPSWSVKCWYRSKR